MPWKSLPAAFGLAAALTLSAALPALAVAAVATTGLNVRTCGSTDCDIVDVLEQGEEVDVEYCEGLWCAIDRRGPDGFVNANYLAPADEEDVDEDDSYDADDFDDRIYFERRPFQRRLMRRYGPFD